jgi:hypothetical protein
VDFYPPPSCCQSWVFSSQLISLCTDQPSSEESGRFDCHVNESSMACSARKVVFHFLRGVNKSQHLPLLSTQADFTFKSLNQSQPKEEINVQCSFGTCSGPWVDTTFTSKQLKWTNRSTVSTCSDKLQEDAPVVVARQSCKQLIATMAMKLQSSSLGR